MRISDWSSDVCSSDLKGIKENLAEEIDPDVRRLYPLYAESVRNLGTPVIGQRYFECLKATFVDASEVVTVVKNGQPLDRVLSFFFRDELRSDERRVGTECVSVCKSRR